jgi:hypothetical protein
LSIGASSVAVAALVTGIVCLPAALRTITAGALRATEERMVAEQVPGPSMPSKTRRRFILDSGVAIALLAGLLGAPVSASASPAAASCVDYYDGCLVCCGSNFAQCSTCCLECYKSCRAGTYACHSNTLIYCYGCWGADL